MEAARIWTCSLLVKTFCLQNEPTKPLKTSVTVGRTIVFCGLPTLHQRTAALHNRRQNTLLEDMKDGRVINGLPIRNPFSR
jgi:hypothetical protein